MTSESEISIFGADRYYNMKLDYDKRKENQIPRHQMKPKTRPGAVSLPCFLRNPSPRSLSCKMSCSDKKSIHVHNNVEQARPHRKKYGDKPVGIERGPELSDGGKKSPPRRLVKDKLNGPNRGEAFALPVFNSRVQNLAEESYLECEEPRRSLEVFGSHMLSKKDIIVLDLERRLSMLTWDAIPKAQSKKITSVSDGLDEDMKSDTSSDLFEIEDLTGSRQSDGLSKSMTPKPRYNETTEASSVVYTADTSGILDYEQKPDTGRDKSVKPKVIVSRDVQRSRANRLLGCKSHKAVRVAESALRTTEKAKPELQVKATS